MNRSDVDWQYVRRYTGIPLVTAAVAIALLVTAFWTHARQVRLHADLTANHSAVHQDYDALIDQRRLVDRYHRRYQGFAELGFVGRESRLDWVATLRDTAAELRLTRLGYSIEPQQAVIPPVTSAFGGHDMQIRVSPMRLSFGLRHELELLRFFDELQRRAPGLISVGQCDVTREGVVSGSGAGNGFQCEL